MATKTKTRAAVTRGKTKRPVKPEKDSVYLLKLLLYMLVGTFYVRIQRNGTIIPIPLGLVVGLAFAMHEHFRIDKKIELAILLVSAGIGLVAGYGMFIRVY